MAQRVGRGIAVLFHDRGTRSGWVVSSTPRPQFTPGKEPVPIVQEVEWAPGPVWTGGKSRPHWDSIPDRPARSQSLYWLSYPAHDNLSRHTRIIIEAHQKRLEIFGRKKKHLSSTSTCDVFSLLYSTHFFLQYLRFFLDDNVFAVNAAAFPFLWHWHAKWCHSVLPQGKEKACITHVWARRLHWRTVPRIRPSSTKGTRVSTLGTFIYIVLKNCVSRS